MLIILILIVEFVLSIVSFVWMIALLGFADETHRSKKASLLGKLYASICIVVAFSPLSSTVWVAWKYYFTEGLQALGLGLPVIILFVSVLICLGLIRLYDFSYKNKS